VRDRDPPIRDYLHRSIRRRQSQRAPGIRTKTQSGQGPFKDFLQRKLIIEAHFPDRKSLL
jgi:hypothetical protein